MNNLPSNFTGIGVVVYLPSGANAVDGSHVTIDGVITKHSRTSPTDGGMGPCFVAVDWVEAGFGS